MGLAGGWPVVVLGIELVILLFRGARDPLDRLFRATLVVATLAWLVPAWRSFNHTYYVLYFQLPIALAFADSWSDSVRSGRF